MTFSHRFPPLNRILLAGFFDIIILSYWLPLSLFCFVSILSKQLKLCITSELIAGHDDVHPLHFYGVHADFDPLCHHGVDNLVDMGLQRNDAIASIRDAGGDRAVQGNITSAR